MHVTGRRYQIAPQGVPDDCELPGVGAGNPTPVLGSSSWLLLPWSRLSSPQHPFHVWAPAGDALPTGSMSDGEQEAAAASLVAYEAKDLCR